MKASMILIFGALALNVGVLASDIAYRRHAPEVFVPVCKGVPLDRTTLIQHDSAGSHFAVAADRQMIDDLIALETVRAGNTNWTAQELTIAFRSRLQNGRPDIDWVQIGTPPYNDEIPDPDEAEDEK
jgi:hypothetical protein